MLHMICSNWFACMHACVHEFQGASLNRGLPSRKFYPLVHAANARLPNATRDDA